MREISILSNNDSVNILVEICRQARTAATWTVSDFQTEVVQRTSRIFIISENQNNIKTVFGFCAVRFALDMAEITNFAILPQMQHKHLGTEIFAHTLNFLKTQGIKEVTLEVSSKNIIAQEFYKKFKFITVGVRKKFYNMVEDALLLKLNL